MSLAALMRRLWYWLRDEFWALPLACVLAAAGLALGLTTIDENLDTDFRLPFLFTGGPEGARALLSAIISSMISFTGLVFSITIVVLQLTSSQFSPRVLRTFLRDRFNQVALGVFTATFVYGLVVLRAVRGTAQVDSFVPQVSITVAFVFVLASVVLFLGYIHHIAQSIRAATIISNIAEDTRELIEQRHPRSAEVLVATRLPSGTGRAVLAPSSGIVQRIRDERLVGIAEARGLSVVVTRAPGEFVLEGSTLLEVFGPEKSGGPDDAVPGASELCQAIELGSERTLDEDVGFGMRQLVDIAERALSPGINDPTTAIQVIDQLHDLLRRLATRPLVARQRFATSGRLVLSVAEPRFVDYLALAVDEIAHWGADSPRVQRRLRVLLLDLVEVARPEHLPAVRLALARLASDDASDPLEGMSATAASDVGLREDLGLG